jgi:hypothetical protein
MNPYCTSLHYVYDKAPFYKGRLPFRDTLGQRPAVRSRLLLHQQKESAASLLPAGTRTSGIWIWMYLSAPHKKTATHVEKVGAPSTGGFSFTGQTHPTRRAVMGFGPTPIFV